MMKNRSCGTLLYLIIVSISVIDFSNTEDNGRLQDVLRKNTNSNSSGNFSNNEEDVFKTEAMKMIKKCQREDSGNRKQNDTNTYNNGYGRNSNGYNSYGSGDNTRDADYRNSGYGYDYSNRNNKNSYNSFEYGSNSNNQRPKNCSENDRSGFGASNNNDDYGGNQGTYYSSHRGEGSNRNFGFDRNYFSARVRRDDRRNNDNQCVSQCVFGYMNLVDENQNPSETLTIKWLQEHTASNDLKRIKALRDVRRCFAKLSTSDIEDGCDFSKELSNCLNLDLE